MFEPGIYFGLEAELYHADPALGSTDVKRLLVSAPDYWWHSRLNPARPTETEPTPAQAFGRAVHLMVLEGEAAFSAAYMREPDPDGLLMTMDHLTQWLTDNADRVAEAGVAKLPKTKAGMVALISGIDPAARILDKIRADADEAGVTILRAEEYDRIMVASQMIRRNPELWMWAHRRWV